MPRQRGRRPAGQRARVDGRARAMWPSAAFSPYPPQPHTRRQMRLLTRSCPPLPASRMCGWNSTCSGSSRWQRPHSVGRANSRYCQLWMLPQAPQCSPSPRHSSLHHSSSRCFHQGLQPPARRCPPTPPTPLGCPSRHPHSARSTQAHRGGAHSWRVTTTERGLPAGSAQKPQQGAGAVVVSPTPKTHKSSCQRGATRGWGQGLMEQGRALGRAPPLWGRQTSPQGARAGAPPGGPVPPNAHLPCVAQRACPYCGTLKAR